MSMNLTITDQELEDMSIPERNQLLDALDAWIISQGPDVEFLAELEAEYA